jgi:hypothetical protein
VLEVDAVVTEAEVEAHVVRAGPQASDEGPEQADALTDGVALQVHAKVHTARLPGG